MRARYQARDPGDHDGLPEVNTECSSCRTGPRGERFLRHPVQERPLSAEPQQEVTTSHIVFGAQDVVSPASGLLSVLARCAGNSAVRGQTCLAKVAVKA